MFSVASPPVRNNEAGKILSFYTTFNMVFGSILISLHQSV